MSKRHPIQQVPSSVFTVEEFGDYLRISRASAWRLLKSGAVPKVRFGGATRVRKSDADAFIDRSVQAVA